MPTPSLILVPARFKTGKLYTPVATTSGGVVLGASGDFNVTRATTATRVNASGLIESVASGIPRLDYFASGGVVGCPALLVEPSGSNLARQSAGINVSGTWIRSNMSVTTGITSPEALTTAFDIVESSDVTAQTHELAQTGFSVVSGTSYTFSLFIKAGTNSRNLRLAVGGANFVGSPVAIFSPTSGTVVSSTDCTASVENYGNGWFRCRITATADLTGSSFLGIYTASGTSVSYIGNGSGSVQVWGAQAETGSVATSYIPTTTAAATRNAEVISLSGAVSGCIGQTEGTIYVEFAYFGTPTVRSGPVYLRQAASRGLSINYSPSDSPLGINFISRNDAGPSPITIVSGALQIGTYYKIAIGYDAAGTAAGGSQASGVVAYVNGVQTAIGTFRVPDAAGLTEFRMYGANAGTDTEAFNGRIRAAALYTTRLTNAQLQALTT